MSVFNNGGGTLKSGNKPAAFIELAHALAKAEQLASTADVPLNNITMTYDGEALLASVTASLPIAATVGAGGGLSIAAANYLPTAAFNPGAGGDLHAANLPAAFLEMAQLLNASEQAVVVNAPNNITIALDLETGTATVTAALPITTTTDSAGRVTIVPTDYL